MAYERFSDQPDVTGAEESWRDSSYDTPEDRWSSLENEFQAMGASEQDNGQTLIDPEDPIEALIAEAKAEFARPPASRRTQPTIPSQPTYSRDEADHRHHLMQEVEFHPDFNRRPRAEILEMMLAAEAAQKAAALATPDQPYTPSYQSDLRRIAAREKRKSGDQA